MKHLNKTNILYFLFLVIFILLSLFPDTCYSEPCKVTTKGDRIYVNGKLYFIKGICYNTYFPKKGNGPYLFASLDQKTKEKEFKLMKEAGFNTIRIYTPMPNDFYDLAEKYNLKVIEPILTVGGYTNVKNTYTLQECINQAVNRVEQMKKHPAILMWSLWNDAPFHKNIVEKYGKKRVNIFFKKIYDAVKKIDPNHPITGANMVNVKNGFDMGFKFLDVIGCNSYIGLDYSGYSWKNSQFSKTAARHYVNKLKKFSKKYKKPVIITEVGFPTHKKPNKQGKVLTSQFKIIGEKIAGVCVFEFTDEWWKAGKTDILEPLIEDNWGILTAYRMPKEGYIAIKKIFNKTKTESYGFSPEIFEKKQSKHITIRHLK